MQFVKTKIEEKLVINLSRAGHPLIITPWLSLIFLLTAGLGFIEAVKWTGIGILIGIVPFITFLKLHSDYAIRKVAERQQRVKLYVLGLLEIFTLGITMYILNAPEVLKVGILGVLASALTGYLINYFEKISVHVGTISAFAGALCIYSIPKSLLAYIFAVIIGWSRIELDKHSIIEVILGLFVPGFTMSLVLWLLL